MSETTELCLKARGGSARLYLCRITLDHLAAVTLTEICYMIRNFS